MNQYVAREFPEPGQRWKQIHFDPDTIATIVFIGYDGDKPKNQYVFYRTNNDEVLKKELLHDFLSLTRVNGIYVNRWFLYDNHCVEISQHFDDDARVTYLKYKCLNRELIPFVTRLTPLPEGITYKIVDDTVIFTSTYSSEQFSLDMKVMLRQFGFEIKEIA